MLCPASRETIWLADTSDVRPAIPPSSKRRDPRPSFGSSWGANLRRRVAWVFTPERRTQTRTALIKRARQDPRISGGAVTGSFARGEEDRWSDIDLFFAVAPWSRTPPARIKRSPRTLRA
ncbi:nucleotidyltransferase domain-containing protein [Streptomyces sp. NPDC091972]|uniref:nucleotidyltransferase domain-containing protein n=1 Tax=Streptomyces sp. NPDC091972 TaxID=3366007 RepID=UPI003807EF77